MYKDFNCFVFMEKGMVMNNLTGLTTFRSFRGTNLQSTLWTLYKSRKAL